MNGVSPDGATIVGPTSQTLTDANDYVWSLGPATPDGSYIVERGGVQFASGVANELAIEGGVVWALNAANQWYMSFGTSWIAEPTGPIPAPDPPPSTPPTFTVSPDGATIVGPTSQTLTDANDYVWSLGPATPDGSYIVERGGVQFASGVANELAIEGGVVWALNAANQWYMSFGTSWIAEPTGPIPAPDPPPSTPPTFTVSPDGATIVGPTSQTLTDANDYVWSLGPATPDGSYIVERGGVQFASGVANELAIEGGVVWALNAANQWYMSFGTSWIAEPTGPIPAPDPPPSTPPTFTVSPDGATIVGPTSQTLTDANDYVWSLGPATPDGSYIVERGGVQFASGVANELAIEGGVVWALNAANQWYMSFGTSWIAEPTGPIPAPDPPPSTPPTFTVSPDGATIVGPTSQTLTDANDYVWSLGPATPDGSYIVERGGVQFASGVANELAIEGGVVWALNAANQWYMSFGTSWIAEPTGPIPAPDPPPSTPPTFTVSPDGATIVGPTSQTLTDANDYVWSLGPATPDGSYIVERGGVQFASGVANELAIEGGVVWALNAANQWYMSFGTSWIAEPTGPIPAPDPPPSTPPTFTVSPDGATIVGPTSQTLTDANDYVWSLGPATPDGSYIVERGGVQFASGVANELAIEGGVVWALNAANQWYMSFGTSWIAEPTGPIPAPDPPPSTPPTFTVSPDGATIVGPTSQTLTDANDYVWSLGPATPDGSYIVERGGVQFASGVANELAIEGGVVWALNAANQWYMSFGTSWIAEPGLPDPTVTWANGISGTWQTASYWTPATVPGVENGTFITAAGTYTVTDPQSTSVYSIATAAGVTLDITGGTFTTNAGTGTGFNAGIIRVEDGAVLNVQPSTVMNTGELQVSSNGRLDLVGATIAGGTLANSGTVDSTGMSVLAGVMATNAGNLEIPQGLMTISGEVENTGNLKVDNATLDISGIVTGSGTATIGTNGILEFGSASSQNVTLSGTTAALKLDDAQNFAGTVAGLANSDSIDLANFQFSNNPMINGVTGTGAAGSTTNVTVTDGSLKVTLELLNQYTNQFAVTSSAYSLTTDHYSPNPGTLLQLATPH